ncbi:MAG: hypothetical protein ABR587_15865 [Candidatus Binatia bacterium]
MPAQVRPYPAVETVPPSPRKYWTRRGVAEWLRARLAEDIPTVVGIDHASSFPLAYFETHGLALDWPAFLEDFHRHWPTDGDHVIVDSVRNGSTGLGSARAGNTRWRRITEKRAGAAKSVFHFDVQGSVAKSTHSGLPWLLRLRREFAGRVHFWPFDGWEITPGRSAVVRCTRHFGVVPTAPKAAPPISTMPTASRGACAKPIATAPFQNGWHPP